MTLISKLPALTLVLGLAVTISMSSFKSNNVLTQYGNDNGTWVPLTNLTPGDPNDLQPGEYACIDPSEPVCTAFFEGTPGTNPTGEIRGTFIYVEPEN